MTLMTLFWTLVVAAQALPVGEQLPRPEEWVRADLATVRLRPAAFRSLPRDLQADLQRRGCTVPQAFTGGPPHNVIRGRFLKATGFDWAALCSRHRRSSIIVFWGGSARAVSELAERPDQDFLQVTGPGTIGFSRALGVATPRFIREHNEQYRGRNVPKPDHDGINDIFVEKASVVWYRHRGLWLRLSGAD